jgi:hydrogenase maturation protein HypF
MTDPAQQHPAVERWTIVVRGVIQGVGFRPFVYNAARALGLAGWVRNEADTVRIEVQGATASLEEFETTLRHKHPPQARIESVEITRSPGGDGADREFQIRASPLDGTPRPTIPADLATCPSCLEEVFTPGELRYRYPFTNCTNCGPRWSIIQKLPYDRPRTSMAGFRMCPACEAEYHNPSDRRFHAQPIACPQCGPRLELLDARGNRQALGPEAAEGDSPIFLASCHKNWDSPLHAAVKAVLAGEILALKGLGGFQLIVDATDERAVARLRQRKRRPDKPLAVMLAGLDDARARCEVSDEEARTLQSPEAPILLLRRRSDGRAVADVAASVAPGNPFLGVMLPYTPLHHLLMREILRPIVCTSGNLSEEPMAITIEDALKRLGPIADVFLVHDRPIVRPVDDSVGRITPEGLQLLRRARGYAPRAIGLGRLCPKKGTVPLRDRGTFPFFGPTVLAVGGHLKNTVALSLGTQVVLSAHIGDLDNLAAAEVHDRAIADLVDFFRVVPDIVACDLHPDYASTRSAERLAASWGVPLVRVQHHHAHVAACMAEHRLEGPVLGLSWDGTGYGTDGTIWGGEALECAGWDTEKGTGPICRNGPKGASHKLDLSPFPFRRVAHLRTFSLPGGDRAVREPRRSGLALLFEIMGPAAAEIARPWFAPGATALTPGPSSGTGEGRLDRLVQLLARPRLCPRTSSLGRLFDGVAALCGLPGVISFEGQAAMALEFAADPDCDEAYPFPLTGDGPAVADWEPLVRAILADRSAGVPPGRVSARFHNALAELAVSIARRWQPSAGSAAVVLSGGCFQNALLAGRVRSRLTKAGFAVYTHGQVPPNDGGIALGQAAIAARWLG